MSEFWVLFVFECHRWLQLSVNRCNLASHWLFVPAARCWQQRRCRAWIKRCATWRTFGRRSVSPRTRDYSELMSWRTTSGWDKEYHIDINITCCVLSVSNVSQSERVTLGWRTGFDWRGRRRGFSQEHNNHDRNYTVPRGISHWSTK